MFHDENGCSCGNIENMVHEENVSNYIKLNFDHFWCLKLNSQTIFGLRFVGIFCNRILPSEVEGGRENLELFLPQQLLILLIQAT